MMMMIKTCMLHKYYSLLNTFISFLPLVTVKAKKGSLWLLPLDASKMNRNPMKHWGRMVCMLLSLILSLFCDKAMTPSVNFFCESFNIMGVKIPIELWHTQSFLLEMASNFFLVKLLNWQAENQVPSKPALSKAVFALVRFVCMNLLVALLTSDCLTL